MALIHSGVAPAAGHARGSQLIPWGTVPREGRASGHHQLFLLRVRGLDILQLVLYLPSPGSWTESEGQRVLRDASFSGHVGWLRSGRDDQ